MVSCRETEYSFFIIVVSIALLFELLQIFVSEKLEAFVDFVHRNRAYFEEAGFDYEACVNKMRLLSLASLGTYMEIYWY